MVGALADWFAVTALFRHPLRLPIPHTAIIPRKKDQIGASLGTFVQENFLTRAVVEEKLDHDRRPGPARRLPRRPRPRRAAGRRRRRSCSPRSTDAAARRRPPARRRRARRPQAARDPGRAGAGPRPRARRRGRPAPGGALGGAARCWPASCRRTGWCSGPSSATPPPPGCPTGSTTGCSTGCSPACRASSTRSATTRGTSCAASYDARLRAYVHALRTDPDTAARVEDLKKELLEHPAVRTWSGSLWTNAKNAVLTAAADPDSELRTRVAAMIRDGARLLQTDPTLRELVQRHAHRIAGYLVERFSGDLADAGQQHRGPLGHRGDQPADRAAGRPRPAVDPGQRHRRRRPRRPGDLHGRPAARLRRSAG